MKKWWIFLLPLCLGAAEKVVSLSPAVTELVIFAGGRTQLCGRSGVCDQPAVKHLPVAGDLGKPFPESVLRCGATMVISDTVHPQAQWQTLKRCGVKIELLNNRSIDDLPENVRRIGKELQLPAAEARAEELNRKITALKNNRPATLKRAVVLFWSSPLISCGKDTFIDSALALAGVKNVAAPAGSGYFILTPEFLLAAKPEILIFIGVPDLLADEMLGKPVFRSLRHCRRIFLDRNNWSRLTPGLPDAVAALKVELQ